MPDTLDIAPPMLVAPDVPHTSDDRRMQRYELERQQALDTYGAQKDAYDSMVNGVRQDRELALRDAAMRHAQAKEDEDSLSQIAKQQTSANVRAQGAAGIGRLLKANGQDEFNSTYADIVQNNPEALGSEEFNKFADYKRTLFDKANSEKAQMKANGTDARLQIIAAGGKIGPDGSVYSGEGQNVKQLGSLYDEQGNYNPEGAAYIMQSLTQQKPTKRDFTLTDAAMNTAASIQSATATKNAADEALKNKNQMLPAEATDWINRQTQAAATLAGAQEKKKLLMQQDPSLADVFGEKPAPTPAPSKPKQVKQNGIIYTLQDDGSYK